MDNLIDVLRAKTSDQENYLLKDHLKEAVRRVVQLSKFVKENQDAFDYNLLPNDETFQKLVVAAALHDFGKIDYNFQKKVFKQDERESESWQKVKTFLKPLNNPQIRYPRHEILSAVWSIFLINNTELDKKIRTAILLHHYNEYFLAEKDLMEIIFNYHRAVVSYLEFFNIASKDIQKILESLFNYIKEEFPNSELVTSAIESLETEINNIKKANLLLKKINSHEDDISKFAEFYDIENENPDYDFLVLLGLLRRCDYSSSGNVDVEHTGLKNVFKGLTEIIENEISNNENGIHLWQKDVIESINPTNSLILVAPTGSGKTEFALLWAEKINRKLVYTLPLRVALNDLFDRLRNSDYGYFEPESVDILHSTAFIEYLKEEKNGNDTDMDKMMTSARILSSPVLLTTPDQVFLTSLNYYGSDKVISIYPFSLIVLDEIQTYNPEMAAIIIKTLQIIHKLGGNILVITATFPPYFEKFFEQIGDKCFEIVDVADLEPQIKNKIKNFNLRRHQIKVIEKSLFDNDLQLSDKSRSQIEECLELFKEKNLFLTVNNVKKAINLYKMLKNENENKVCLLHSRLTELEKSRRINEIKKQQVKGEKVIVVATQIIEASVNLDFDAMITEISTIDSQIQRWGRVYRNRTEDYLENIPNIVIFAGEKSEDDGLKVDNRTAFIYDVKVLSKTFEILKEYEKIQHPLNYENERNMIKDVFERKVNEKTLKEIYEDEIEKTLEYLDYFTVEKKSQAQKLFRNIAGHKVVVPGLIEMEATNDESVNNILAKSIRDNKQSWREIIDKIKEINGKKMSIWELKKILYEYSINVPIYYEEKTGFWNRDTKEFKGFFVWNKVENEELNFLKEYGLDSIFNEREDPPWMI